MTADVKPGAPAGTEPAAEPNSGPKGEAWRLRTAANGVTVARIACTPLLVVLVLQDTPSWRALACWFVLTSSDAADGWLARRQGTTASGAFLDPLADKALVLGALAAMVAQGSVSLAPVVLLAGREAVITLYRVAVARRGISVPARRLAKVKTLVEFAAVGFVLMPIAWSGRLVVAHGALWLAVALAWASAGQYLLDSRMAGRAVPAGA